MKFFLIAGIFQFLILFQQSAAAGFDVIAIAREFGFPVAFCLILWFWFSKQNEKRHDEQREFWADNNRYLRELVAKSSDNCKFQK